MSLQVGSLVLVNPLPISSIGHKLWMIVLEIADDQVWLVPVTHEIALAGDLDIILSEEDTSLGFDVAVLTHLEIQIGRERLPSPVFHMSNEVISEIDGCQNGNPGKDFVHGHLMRTPQIDWRISRISYLDSELTRSYSEQAWTFYESIAPLAEEMNLSQVTTKLLATSSAPNPSAMKTRRDVLMRLSASSPRARQRLNNLSRHSMNEMVPA